MDNTEGVLRRAPLFDALDDEGARTLRRSTGISGDNEEAVGAATAPGDRMTTESA